MCCAVARGRVCAARASRLGRRPANAATAAFKAAGRRACVVANTTTAEAAAAAAASVKVALFGGWRERRVVGGRVDASVAPLSLRPLRPGRGIVDGIRQ